MTNFDLIEHNWGEVLANKSHRPVEHLRIICPFIKKSAIEIFLKTIKPKRLSVITRFSLEDMAAGVSDVSALEYVLSKGGKICGIKNLHAKVYILGDVNVFVTSANLTESALFGGNHEFGIRLGNPKAIARCIKYFEILWKKGNKRTSPGTLAVWQKQVENAKKERKGDRTRSNLSDHGADAGLSTSYKGKKAIIGSAEKSFIKFFGNSSNRVTLNHPVIKEIETSGGNWAVCYPKSKRPRSVLEGSTLFYGRLIDDGDIRIFARSIGHAHDDEIDNATKEDMKRHKWKIDYPRYIRVSNAEFIRGTMKDGVSLKTLMAEFAHEAFASTLRNSKMKNGNANPRRAYGQQAAVELSPQASAWLNEKLENAFNKNGIIPEEEYNDFYNPQISRR